MLMSLFTLTASAVDLPFYVVEAQLAQGNEPTAIYRYEMQFADAHPDISDTNDLLDDMCAAASAGHRVWVEWQWSSTVTASGALASAQSLTDTELRFYRPGAFDRVKYGEYDIELFVIDDSMTVPEVHSFDISATQACKARVNDTIVVTIDGEVILDPGLPGDSSSGSITVVPFPLVGTHLNSPVLHIEGV